MPTVSQDLDTIQLKLHDNGAIWTRAELLRWYNDAYRRLLSRSDSVKAFYTTDLPPRYTYSYTYEWEDRHVSGSSWMCMLVGRDSAWRVTAAWEAQQGERVAAPTAGTVGVTQQWERAYVTDVDRHYDVALPKDYENAVRVTWDNRILLPLTTIELDQSDFSWYRRVGRLLWWTTGMGRQQMLELYQIQTDYVQSYQLIDADKGLPRQLTSDAGRAYGTEPSSLTPRNGWAYTDGGDSQVMTGLAAYLSGFGWRCTYYRAADAATSFCMFAWEQDTVEGASTIRTGGTLGTYAWEAYP